VNDQSRYPRIAAEPRIRAAVLGLNGAEIPAFELHSTLRFFARHLG